MYLPPISVDRNIDVDESEDQVKTGKGRLHGWYMFNAAGTTRYVRYYDGTVASVVVGTTVPLATIPLPAGGGANLNITAGIPFATGLVVAATTGVADNDTGAPASNDVIVNTLYV